MLINEIFEQILEKKEKYYVWSIYLDKYNTLDRSEDIDIFKIILYIMDLKYDYNSKKLLDLEQQETLDKIYNISLTRDNIDKLISFDYTCLPVEITAKLNLFLWEYIKNSLAFAEKAIKEYYILYEKNFDIDEWVDCFDYLKVVVKLCRRIGESNEIASEYLDKCFNSLLSINGEDRLYLSLSIIELLIEVKYKKLNDITSILDKIIKISEDEKDIWKVESAYRVKCELLKHLKLNAQIKDVKLDLAKFYEKLLDFEDDNLIHQNMDVLNKLIKIYKNDGARSKSDFERIKKIIVNEQKKIIKTMGHFTHEVDLSEQRKYFIYVTQNLNMLQCLIFLMDNSIFYNIRKLREEMIEEVHSCPFAYLIHNSFYDTDGRCIYKIPGINFENEEIVNQHLYRFLRRYEGLLGDTGLKWILEYIKSNFEFDLKNIDFIAINNLLIPSSRQDTVAFAIYLGLTGRIYESLQILVIQMEECFRNLAKMLGGVPYVFDDDGTSDVKTIGSLLEMEEIIDVVDEDIVFCFKGLLNEKAGSNFRNQIAHGILDRYDAERGDGIYLFCAIMKFLMYFSKKTVDVFVDNRDYIQRINDEFNNDDMMLLSYLVEFSEENQKIIYKFLDFENLNGEADSIQKARRTAQGMLFEKINEYKRNNIEIPAPTILEVVPNKREIISVVVKK